MSVRANAGQQLSLDDRCVRPNPTEARFQKRSWVKRSADKLLGSYEEGFFAALHGDARPLLERCSCKKRASVLMISYTPTRACEPSSYATCDMKKAHAVLCDV